MTGNVIYSLIAAFVGLNVYEVVSEVSFIF